MYFVYITLRLLFPSSYVSFTALTYKLRLAADCAYLRLGYYRALSQPGSVNMIPEDLLRMNNIDEQITCCNDRSIQNYGYKGRSIQGCHCVGCKHYN